MAACPQKVREGTRGRRRARRGKWTLQSFDAVLFDLDGTLLDSAPGIFDAFCHTLAQFGTEATQQQLRRFLGPPLHESFSRLLPPGEVERAIGIYRRRYAEKSGPLTGVYPGVPQMLAALRAAGYTICLATSKLEPVALQLLREKGLADAFDCIGGSQGDTALDTKTAVMRRVLSRPALQNKRAVMVGDRDNDMQGAADCGLPALGALYGYGSAEELAPYAPLAMPASVEDLRDWLLEHRAGMREPPKKSEKDEDP